MFLRCVSKHSLQKTSGAAQAFLVRVDMFMHSCEEAAKVAKEINDIEEERHFTKGKNVLLPVPRTVIDVNPNITQNPNY